MHYIYIYIIYLFICYYVPAEAISHMSGVANFLVYSLFEFAGACMAAGIITTMTTTITTTITIIITIITIITIIITIIIITIISSSSSRPLSDAPVTRVRLSQEQLTY